MPAPERLPKPAIFDSEGNLRYPKDLSGRLHQLGDKPLCEGAEDGEGGIPMYSFSSPAYRIWQYAFDGMIEGGMTHREAVDWLRSKNTRWWMDANGDPGGPLDFIGREISRSALGKADGGLGDTPSAHELLDVLSSIPEGKRATALRLLAAYGLTESA